MEGRRIEGKNDREKIRTGERRTSDSEKRKRERKREGGSERYNRHTREREREEAREQVSFVPSVQCSRP